jgi:hypothetical protein
MGQAALRKSVEFEAHTVVSRTEQIYKALLQKTHLSQKTDMRDDIGQIVKAKNV